MTWATRGARAGALSVLAVGWGLLAHLGADGHGAGGGVRPGALLWAGTATVLLAWFLPARRAGSGPVAGAARLLVAVVAGQAATHAALALAPLLSQRTRSPVATPGARGPAAHDGHLAVVVAGPSPSELLAALGHGGTTVLLLHGLASLTVVVLWAAAATLWREAVAWWGRLVAPGTVRGPVGPRWPVAGRTVLAAACTAHRSWDGRAPPTPSAVL
ncbi:hypothetical protein ACQE98_04540 [Ornithinimicrobium sp. W1679]|uniref:hypothetical protein n=1 Tax=Ornithinimicrobium sp. W1679 TaxID=3418770 RepID=UPI003CF7579C